MSEIKLTLPTFQLKSLEGLKLGSTFFIHRGKNLRRQFSFCISLQLVSQESKLLQCFMYISKLIFYVVYLFEETMYLKNFSFMKKRYASEMASMKITFFDICDTNWTQMVDPKDTNMELNRILIFRQLKIQKPYCYQLFDVRNS